MKKYLRFAFVTVLALAIMINATAVSALAYTETLIESGVSVVEVEVEYQAATDNRSEIEAEADGTGVYSVVLEWNPSGKIVYNAGKTLYSWNDEALKYSTEVTGRGWTVNDAKLSLTVKNRSNRPVEISCADPVPIDGVKMTGSYDRQRFGLPSAATGGFEGVGTEQIGKALYTIDTVGGNISEATTKIAGITVTVIGK